MLGSPILYLKGMRKSCSNFLASTIDAFERDPLPVGAAWLKGLCLAKSTGSLYADMAKQAGKGLLRFLSRVFKDSLTRSRVPLKGSFKDSFKGILKGSFKGIL